MDDFITVREPFEIRSEGLPLILENIELEKCPVCGHKIFTHDQAVELDIRRRQLENPKKCDPSCEIFGTEYSCGDKCQKQSTI